MKIIQVSKCRECPHRGEIDNPDTIPAWCPLEEEKQVKYMFDWCEKCDYLSVCYSNGEGPKALYPDCGYGTAIKEEAE